MITFLELNVFYNRVKGFPIIYLTDLANAIQKKLYEFNAKKIDNLVVSLANRMERADAEKLILALKSKY